MPLAVRPRVPGSGYLPGGVFQVLQKAPCTVEVPDEFNYGLTTRKAIFGAFMLYGSFVTMFVWLLTIFGVARDSVTGATADGRRAGLPVSEGISPVQGADRKGPTAVFRSAAKMDHIKTGGTLLNMKFLPSVLDNAEGIDKLSHLVRAYFRMDGHHIQFNVVSADTLRDAQKHPEKYQDLVKPFVHSGRVVVMANVGDAASDAIASDVLRHVVAALPARAPQISEGLDSCARAVHRKLFQRAAQGEEEEQQRALRPGADECRAQPGALRCIDVTERLTEDVGQDARRVFMDPLRLFLVEHGDDFFVALHESSSCEHRDHQPTWQCSEFEVERRYQLSRQPCLLVARVALCPS